MYIQNLNTAVLLTPSLCMYVYISRHRCVYLYVETVITLLTALDLVYSGYSVNVEFSFFIDP